MHRRVVRHPVRMRIVRLAAVLLVAGATLVGCSDSEKEPEPSAQEEFCTAYRDFYEQSQSNQDASETEVVARMKGFATKLDGLEVPEEMSADAQKGLETWIDLMSDLPDDATEADVIALDQELSEQETGWLETYYLYSNAICLSADATS